MIKVVLHGSLRSVGGPFKLHAQSPMHACRLLAAQIPQFDAAMRSGTFRVRLGPQGKGGTTLRAGGERMRLGRHNEIHITPRGSLSGGKNKGAMGKLIIGVALIGIGLTGGALAGGLGAGLAIGGETILSFGSIALAGGSMLVTGLAQTLSSNPGVSRYETREPPDERPNFLFNGGVNTLNEGASISWVWGKDVFVGSNVISAGIIDEQIGPGLPVPVVNGIIADFGSSARGTIIAAKGKKAKYKPPEESPDSLQSKSIARILEAVGEGELELYDGLRSVYLDKTAVQNFDDSINFEGYKLTWRSGTADQPSIPGITEIEGFQDVGSVATFSTPIIATVIEENATAARVSVRFAQGIRSVDSSGDIRPTHSRFAIDVRAFGGDWVEAHNVHLVGKAAAGYQVNYRVELPVGGFPWDLRLRRLDADPVSATITNELTFASYTSLIEARLQYPYTALALSEIDSKAFGFDIPKRLFRVRRVDGLIPSNYDPDTREYGSFWDGTFKRGCTDNPAWALRDLLTSTRFGCGEDIDETAIDDGALYAIAQYCDELVPDGFGGLEPRYTFNGCLSSREDAFQVLNSMAAAFRGMIYWGPGTVVCTQDRPKQLAGVIIPANTIKGEIAYEGIDDNARHTICKVTWNDPEKLGETAVVYEMDQQAMRIYGRREKDIYAWGARTEGLARRIGRWALETDQTAARVATWGAALKQASYMPGDVVAIADPTVSGSNMHGGKVVTYDLELNQVGLDRTLTIEPGHSYSIQITNRDNTSVFDSAILETSGTYTTITLETGLPSAADLPIFGADYTITSSLLEPQQFQILANAQTGKMEYGLTAAIHDPTKFDRIEKDIRVAPRPTSLLPSAIPADPINLVVEEILYQSGTGVRAAAEFGWESNDNRSTFGFETEYMRPGDSTFTPFGRPGFSLTRRLLDITPGVYKFRVRAYSAIGARSNWVEKEVALLALQQVLADVEEFRGAISAGLLNLRWTPIADLREPPYRIRYSAITNAAVDWAQMSDLVLSAFGSQTNVPAAAGTYAIKAKTLYAESNNPAYLVISDIPADFNVVAEVVEGPDWYGTVSNLVISSGYVKYEAGTSGEGIYEFADVFDMGDKYSARISAAFDASAINTEDVMANWGTLAQVETLSGVSSSQWRIRLQISLTDDDPNASPVWTDWADVVQGAYSFRAVRFRLLITTTESVIEVLVSMARVTVDMDDRVITFDDVVTAAGGTTLTFDPPFLIVPRVFVTGQDMNTGDYFRVTAKTDSSVTLRFFNSAGTGISRTADVQAIGAGKKVT